MRARGGACQICSSCMLSRFCVFTSLTLIVKLIALHKATLLRKLLNSYCKGCERAQSKREVSARNSIKQSEDKFVTASDVNGLSVANRQHVAATPKLTGLEGRGDDYFRPYLRRATHQCSHAYHRGHCEYALIPRLVPPLPAVLYIKRTLMNNYPPPPKPQGGTIQGWPTSAFSTIRQWAGLPGLHSCIGARHDMQGSRARGRGPGWGGGLRQAANEEEDEAGKQRTQPRLSRGWRRVAWQGLCDHRVTAHPRQRTECWGLGIRGTLRHYANLPLTLSHCTHASGGLTVYSRPGESEALSHLPHSHTKQHCVWSTPSTCDTVTGTV